jgi:hypothetical protein
MNGFLIAVLRAGIAFAVLVGLFGQIVAIPTTAADEVDRFPPYEPFATPYATALALGAAGHLAVAEIPSPGDGMDVESALAAATAAVAVGAAFAMLTVVVRSLLRKATRLQSEMAAVV